MSMRYLIKNADVFQENHENPKSENDDLHH